MRDDLEMLRPRHAGNRRLTLYWVRLMCVKVAGDKKLLEDGEADVKYAEVDGTEPADMNQDGGVDVEGERKAEDAACEEGEVACESEFGPQKSRGGNA